MRYAFPRFASALFFVAFYLQAPPSHAMRLECSIITTSCTSKSDGTVDCSTAGRWESCTWVADSWDLEAVSRLLGIGPGTGRRTDIFDRGGGPGGLGDTDVSNEKVAEVKPKDCNQTDMPVQIASGNKVLPELDFVLPYGGESLIIARNYDKSLQRSGAFGKHWWSQFERTLTFEYGTTQCPASLSSVSACGGTGTPTAIYALRFGAVLKFTADSPGVWKDTNGSTLTQSGSVWRMATREGIVETYDSFGRPMKLADQRGIGVTYTYNTNNQLSKITHTTGKALTFTWSGSKVTAIVVPDGKAYGYGYNTAGYLASVASPDNLGTRTYHYEDPYQPGGITGISVNGVRLTRYAYQADGRVAWSGYEGGVKRSTFAYGADYTNVTNALGQTTHYELADLVGVKRIISIERPATGSCTAGAASTAYNADGTVDYEIDGLGVKTDYTYDPDKRLTQKTVGIRANGDTSQQQITKFEWDNAKKHRLLSVTEFGATTAQPIRETRYSYYEDSHPAATLLAQVSTTNRTSIGLPAQTLTTTYTYTFHENGLVATQTVDGPIAGSGDAVVYTFDPSGNLTSRKNSLGHGAVYSNYNAHGQPGRVTSENGGITDYTYDTRGNTLTSVRWVGQTAYTTTNTYDARGELKRVVYPDGSEISYSYDSLGRVVAATRKEKGSPYVPTSSGGSGAGLVASNNGGHGSGKLQSPQGICADCEPGGEDPPPPTSEIRGVIDGITNNKTAIVGWACASGLNQSISIHLYLGGPAGSGTYYGAYQADLASEPAVASACSASGANYRFSIPMTTNMREQFGGKSIYVHGISPVGSTNSALTNSGSFVVSKMPPPPVGFLRYTYNLNSQVIKVESGIEYYSSDTSLTLAAAGSGGKLSSGGQGIAACYPDCYEPAPQPSTAVTTLIQSSQVVDYDANGFVAARRGNNGQSLTYKYSANGDLEEVTDALNRVTRYEYDALRRVSHVVDAAGGHTWLSYDALGNVVRVQDPKGNATAYVYDGLGQLWTQTSPDTGTTRFEWNATGQRTKATRQDGSWLSYSYDALGRLTSVGNYAESRVFKYQNCDFGDGNARGNQLCGMATSSGTWTQFRYSPEGLLQSRRDSTSGSDDWTGYSYDGMGRLTGISYPSGVSVGYGYNNGQLTTVTATINGATSTVLDKAYYQPFGTIGGWTHGNGLARRYSYDLDGRLTGISSGDDVAVVVQSLGFSFNAGDEITRITNGTNANQTYTLGYDALSRLTTANTAIIGYDPVGNRTSFNALTYGIDAASNHLQYSTDPSLTRYFSTNANGDIYAYTGTDGVYNALTYDAFNRVATHTRSGTVTSYSYNALDQRVGKAGNTRYIYGGLSQLLAENKAGIWSNYVWLGGEIVGVIRSNQLYYVHNDQVARPEVVTNSSKAVVWRAGNTPFNRAVTTDTFGGLNVGFPGQYWDAESGLWHNGYRSYEPTLGRYLQSDPLGLASGLNTYAYVANNPVGRVDPNGLEDVLMTMWAAGVIDKYPNRRLPDYISVSGNIGHGNMDFTFTRNGTLFSGGGFLSNQANPIRPSKPGLSVSLGKLNTDDCPTGDQVDAFVSGWTTTYGATSPYGVGLSRSVNSTGAATNLIFGTPGMSVDATYLGPARSFGGGW